MKNSQVEYTKAQRHLSRRDSVLKGLVKQLGPCTLRTNDNHFEVLVRSIISQQISSKAAISIGNRLQETLGGRGFQAKAILKTSDEDLRAAGLSTAKRTSLQDLAVRVENKSLRLKELPDLPDEEVIARLLPVRGIGPWTAEMFLIFALGRMDILPVADLGLRVGIQRQYELDDVPPKNELIEIGEKWRPYRTVATWYFWRSFGNVPQS